MKIKVVGKPEIRIEEIHKVMQDAIDEIAKEILNTTYLSLEEMSFRYHLGDSNEN